MRDGDIQPFTIDASCRHIKAAIPVSERLWCQPDYIYRKLKRGPLLGESPVVERLKSLYLVKAQVVLDGGGCIEDCATSRDDQNKAIQHLRGEWNRTD